MNSSDKEEAPKIPCRDVGRTHRIAALWHSNNEAEWRAALDGYWTVVKQPNMEIERAMDVLDTAELRDVDAITWYEFLRDRYFRWKYTAPNRYATTTKALGAYVTEDRLSQLDDIKRELFAFDKRDIRTGLRIACKIRGLGTAGASGLLALMFLSVKLR